MNKTFKKILCVTLLPFVSFGFSHAMESDESTGNIQENSEKITYDDKFFDTFFKNCEIIGSGREGTIYFSQKYPHLVVKKMSLSDEKSKSQLKRGMSFLKKNFENKNFGETIVKLFYVDTLNKYIVMEHIDGISCDKYFEAEEKEIAKLKDKLLSLGFDFFIDNWCIKTIEGLLKIRQDKNHYLTDRNMKNFMITNPPKGNPILVQIDHTFSDKTPPTFEQFKKIFLYVIELHIEKKDDNRWYTLQEYFNTLKKDDQILNGKIMNKMINDFNKIK